MFKKLKQMFTKNKEKKVEEKKVDYTIKIKEGEEVVKWDVLENNPATISVIEGMEDMDFFVAFPLVGILQQKGWDMELLNSEIEGHKWIYVKNNGYYLLPQLIDLYYDENDKLNLSATIQIHHKELFPEGIFEYIYPQTNENNIIDGLFSLFKTWVDLDWETLCDCLNPTDKSKYMSAKISFDEENKKVRQVYYGAVLSYPNIDIEDAKTKGIDVEPYIDEFCPCCLFTKSMEAFDNQIKDFNKNYAIRLFALKAPDGELDADCRVNGEEYPEAEKYLKEYAKTWKDCDIVKLRKQYVVIRNVE